MNAVTETPIDEELAALRAGKTSAACAKIVVRHRSLVKSACLRILQDEGLPEDAAQETRLQLAKNRELSLNGTKKYQEWVQTAALDAKERTQLLTLLGKRIAVQQGK